MLFKQMGNMQNSRINQYWRIYEEFTTAYKSSHALKSDSNMCVFMDYFLGIYLKHFMIFILAI